MPKRTPYFELRRQPGMLAVWACSLWLVASLMLGLWALRRKLRPSITTMTPPDHQSPQATRPATFCGRKAIDRM